MVRAWEGERTLSLLHWGLIPAWAKDRKIGYKMINARAETVADKPAYRTAFRTRRCLIPADGFYEWRRDVTPRQPYYIHRGDGTPLELAGLWETWTDRDSGEMIESCTIVTTEANALMAPIHHRMPVVLQPEAFEGWLTGTASEAAALMGPYAGSELTAHAVSRQVNNPRHNRLDLIELATPNDTH